MLRGRSMWSSDSLADGGTHHFVYWMRKSTVSRMSSVSTERYSSAAVWQGNSEVIADQQKIVRKHRHRYTTERIHGYRYTYAGTNKMTKFSLFSCARLLAHTLIPSSVCVRCQEFTFILGNFRIQLSDIWALLWSRLLCSLNELFLKFCFLFLLRIWMFFFLYFS